MIKLGREIGLRDNLRLNLGTNLSTNLQRSINCCLWSYIKTINSLADNNMRDYLWWELGGYDGTR